MNFRRIARHLLNHFHEQEAAQGTTEQRSEESEYDDRQSLLPFIKEEQRFKRFTDNTGTQSQKDDASQQRELVKWTKRLAFVTGALAFATFIVAFISGLGARDTARLAESAGIQASTAVDTEQRQLRAYVGPVLDSFQFHQGPPAPVGCAGANCISFRIKNYGQTPASEVIHCANWSWPVTDIKVAQDAVFGKCARNLGSKERAANMFPAEAPTVFTGELPAAGELAKGKPLWLLGVTTYDDAFHTAHHTYICRRVIPTVGNDGIQAVGFIRCNGGEEYQDD